MRPSLPLAAAAESPTDLFPKVSHPLCPLRKRRREKKGEGKKGVGIDWDEEASLSPPLCSFGLLLGGRGKSEGLFTLRTYCRVLWPEEEVTSWFYVSVVVLIVV